MWRLNINSFPPTEHSIHWLGPTKSELRSHAISIICDVNPFQHTLDDIVQKQTSFKSCLNEHDGTSQPEIQALTLRIWTMTMEDVDVYQHSYFSQSNFSARGEHIHVQPTQFQRNVRWNNESEECQNKKQRILSWTFNIGFLECGENLSGNGKKQAFLTF